MTGYYLIGAIITAVALILLAWRALTPTERHRGPRARFDADTSGVLIACAGLCPGWLTRHEVHGDGTATCRRCDTPRLMPEARSADWLEVGE